jgi:hypothetical protein
MAGRCRRLRERPAPRQSETPVLPLLQPCVGLMFKEYTRLFQSCA